MFALRSRMLSWLVVMGGLEDISAMGLLVVRQVVIEKHYRRGTPSNQLEIDGPQRKRVLFVLHLNDRAS